jgi:glycosyltransferase involved in cell wall biosynthesis
LSGRDGYAASLRERWGHIARFTGRVPDEEVPLWFSAADVALYLYPRPFSSSGALALALGYGTPAMLSRELAACVGASADMAVERDPQVLADRLRSLAASPRELERLGAATAALARDRSWPHVATRHLDLYEEVIRGHGAPRRRVRAAQPG